MRIEITNKVVRENMVYFDSWDEFATAVEQLFVAEPNKVTKIYGLVRVLSFNTFIFIDRLHVVIICIGVSEKLTCYTFFPLFVLVSLCGKVSSLRW